MYDIVIFVGPKDYDIICHTIEINKKNVLEHRRIYIITNIQRCPHIDGCTMLDENMFPFTIKYIESTHSNIRKDRIGWYFQQLGKLLISFYVDDMLEDYLVIDADTYINKPMCFMKDDRHIFHNSTRFGHEPYRAHMRKLNPALSVVDNLSGIVHHMIFNKKILAELINTVEEYHNGKKFYDIFLENVEKNNTSGASEYEIYFHFMMKYHKSKMIVQKVVLQDIKSIHDKGNHDVVSIHWYKRR